MPVLSMADQRFHHQLPASVTSIGVHPTLSSCCRSLARELLPLTLRGNSVANTNLRGRLSELRRARHCSINSASVKLLEGTTKAAISSPSRHLVKPTTATSFIPTCSARTVSTSEGCTLETPRIIRSDARPRRHRNSAHQVRRRLPDRPNRP